MGFFSKKFVIGFIGCFLALSSPSFADDVPTRKLSKGCSFTFCMPINVALPEGQRVNLAFNIPKGYKCLQEDLENIHLLEFIPQEDQDPYRWSEIITTCLFVGDRLQAKQCVQRIMRGFQAAAPMSKILHQSSESKGAYSTASAAISYMHQGRKELVYMKYFSGPYDCSGFQYSILITDSMTEARALEKIKKFEDENTVIFCF